MMSEKGESRWVSLGVASPTDVMVELQESTAVSRAAVLNGCSDAARRLIQSDEAGESPPERNLHYQHIWVSAAM